VKGTLLFLDVATSGLDPKRAVILEVACMLVSATPDLEVLETFSQVIYHSDSGGELEGPAFHRALMTECQDPCGTGEEIRKVEAKLLTGPWSRAVRVVNRAVEFDRRFLAAHLTTFAATMPRTSLDVNDVEYVATALSGATPLPRGERTYRAEDDLAEAYEALRHYLNHQ
jgi:oligoribonuclease (3'-5' exoribonuclease)